MRDSHIPLSIYILPPLAILHCYCQVSGHVHTRSIACAVSRVRAQSCASVCFRVGGTDSCSLLLPLTNPIDGCSYASPSEPASSACGTRSTTAAACCPCLHPGQHSWGGRCARLLGGSCFFGPCEGPSGPWLERFDGFGHRHSCGAFTFHCPLHLLARLFGGHKHCIGSHDLGTL